MAQAEVAPEVARLTRGAAKLIARATPGTDMATAAASASGLRRVASEARNERRASRERPITARQYPIISKSWASVLRTSSGSPARSA